MARDWRDERIAELEALLEKALERIHELESRLDRSSRNSNQPPSKDTPEQRRNRPKKKPSARQRGAQPGHAGHQRQLLPPGKIENHYPDDCENCGAGLPDVEDPDPIRHQVLELPRIEPDVSEHRRHARECDECGHVTRANLPIGVPRSMFGPRLLALIGLLTGSYRQSRRQVVSLLGDVLGIRVSLGAISEAEQRLSEAVAPAVVEAGNFVRAQPIKHVDATAWYHRGMSRSLWTITTTLVTVFAITLDGGKESLKALLKRARGILVSDRAKVFTFWAMGRRQICWHHLMRKFAALFERGGAGSQIAHELHESAELMFRNWHRIRDGTMTRAEFQRWMRALRQRVESLLERGARLNARGVTGVYADILKHRKALWTFVDHRGVEPTNNAAERDLRPFVVWRKTSYGSQSERGERYAERIMTVTHTLRKQERNVFEYLHQACANAQFRNPPPSLLPNAA